MRWHRAALWNARQTGKIGVFFTDCPIGGLITRLFMNNALFGAGVASLRLFAGSVIVQAVGGGERRFGLVEVLRPATLMGRRAGVLPLPGPELGVGSPRRNAGSVSDAMTGS
jgi:hypothetical protein